MGKIFGNHTTAILIGLAVGAIFAFTRKGTNTGDGMPFSGR